MREPDLGRLPLLEDEFIRWPAARTAPFGMVPVELPGLLTSTVPFEIEVAGDAAIGETVGDPLLPGEALNLPGVTGEERLGRIVGQLPGGVVGCGRPVFGEVRDVGLRGRRVVKPHRLGGGVASMEGDHHGGVPRMDGEPGPPRADRLAIHDHLGDRCLPPERMIRGHVPRGGQPRVAAVGEGERDRRQRVPVAAARLDRQPQFAGPLQPAAIVEVDFEVLPFAGPQPGLAGLQVADEDARLGQRRDGERVDLKPPERAEGRGVPPAAADGAAAGAAVGCDRYRRDDMRRRDGVRARDEKPGRHQGRVMVEVDRKLLPGILGLEVGRIDRPRRDHGAGRLAVGARATHRQRDASAERSGKGLHLEPGRQPMQPVGQRADNRAGGDL